jgi:hypothetical protein
MIRKQDMVSNDALSGRISATAATLCMVSLFGLAGCTPGPSQISQFNGDSVTVRRIELGVPNPADPAVVSEAVRICQSAGKTAQYASLEVNMDTFEVSYLFLCLGQAV